MKTLTCLTVWKKLGTFDIIFCRHVLIYFDMETKRTILKNLIPRLAPDGYLFVGGSEAIIGLTDGLETIADCPGLYRRKAATTPIIQPAIRTGQLSKVT